MALRTNPEKLGSFAIKAGDVGLPTRPLQRGSDTMLRRCGTSNNHQHLFAHVDASIKEDRGIGAGLVILNNIMKALSWQPHNRLGTGRTIIAPTLDEMV
ncbi:hypothetical protein RIF29_26379 [Crotalaria pallida]|uniref:Uncharacterized protein n=1 Tax=Crotalaria pallida TaxID=3830 RepID=A0AAN9ENA1_CROPI